MADKLTEVFAMALGYDLIVRSGYFILDGIGVPNIKGRIENGIARDVRLCYDVTYGIDELTPDTAISYAHKIISAAYAARCVEGLQVDSNCRV